MSKQEILLESGTNELEILEFFINEVGPDGEAAPSYFGINVAKVMQVIESPNLEPPESAPHPSFLGTIPLRDIILPVLDLSVWLAMDRKPEPYDIVIVTEFSQAVTGFLVSGVTEIHRVGWKEVIPPSGIISRSTDAIIGMVDRGDRFIQLLDLETILSELSPPAENEHTVVSDTVYKALVADDSATIRLMLKNSLSASNLSPRLVNNGQEALDTLNDLLDQAQAKDRPITDFVDVVISDIEMPLMDGFTLTKNIKQTDGLRKLPVILYSSIITKELRHKGDSVGADHQIAKPEMHTIPEKAVELIQRYRG